MNDNEIKAFYHQAKQLTAQKIGVEGCEWKFGTELMDDIKSKNSVVFDLLNDFLEAYQQWHDFYVKIEGEKKAGNLPTSENNELMKNVSQRDNTRDALIKALG